MALPPAWSGSFSDAGSLENTLALTGLPLKNPMKNRFREKRWCYAGIVCPELFFGAAVVHLGYITSAFVFAFDRDTGNRTEQTLTFPPLGHVRYDRHPEKGTCRFKALGHHIEIQSLAPGFAKRILVRLPRKKILADLTLAAPGTGFSQMHFPMDMGKGKKAFTSKAAGLSARGSVSLNDKTFTIDPNLDPDLAFGLVDWTHGAYPRKTFWNWACGAGRGIDASGDSPPVSVGFNFSRGVYENGRLENIVWINGQPEPVGEIAFTYDAHAPELPWQISSADRQTGTQAEKQVDLTFFPEGARSADDNFGLVASRFVQPYGRFEGQLTLRDGRKLALDSAGGVVEEHHAKW